MADLTGADRSRLTEMVEHDWVEAALARDWNALMALCSEDFVYMPQDHPMLNGKGETKAFLSSFPTIRRLSQAVQAIYGDDRLTVLQFSFAGTIEVEGTDLSGKGKGLCAAARISGKWLFTSACFNWDGPPA
jgi:hypothetical protein